MGKTRESSMPLKIFASLKGDNFRLFALSVWMLFLELFLIRWISTEIRIFAYVTNLVLLGCFIGIGIGCYFFNKKISILFSIAMLAATAIAVASFPFRAITDLLTGFSDSVIWSQVLKSNNFIPALQGVILTVFMFGMVSAIFFPIGQLLGSMFNSHNKIIVAYSINILGSIVGIWLFSFLSFIYTAPFVWLILSMAIGLIFIERKNALHTYLFLALILFSAVVSTVVPNKPFFNLWTPYQKLDVYKIYIGDCNLGYTVNVNNANYMEILDISSGFVNAHPEIFGNTIRENLKFSQYEIPYLFKKSADDTLIIGAGGGNDVAGALRSNIKNIDAVEIDPGIHKIGLLFHPENPYKDKRVRVYIDDARSFFKKAKKKYDVISFGLLDSHTLTSNYSNMRLDHYLYTLESFNEAKKMLKSDGIMTVSFADTRDWIAVRIRELIKKTFGEEPLVFHISPYGNQILNRGWNMYVIGSDMKTIKEIIKEQGLLKNYIETHKVNLPLREAKLTTDDWPYFYMEKSLIPKTYLCIILSLSILFLLSGRVILSGEQKLNPHFFFLGAAFLLLEFQNITKSSLLFGSTWIVNAYTITAILLLIFLANIVSTFFANKNTKPVYFLLCTLLLILYLVPFNSLNIQNQLLKLTLIVIFLNLPIFFAAIIFINSLKNAPLKSVALGSNLLGACFGGLCESLSFVWGVKALLLLVFLFYILSYYFRNKLVCAK